MVRKLALCTFCQARHGGHARSSAAIARYIFLAKQTTFNAVFLNSSLVQQLIHFVLNKQPELQGRPSYGHAALLFYKCTHSAAGCVEDQL